MVNQILFVHGYSVNTFAAYGGMPKLFRDKGLEAKDLYLSAYNSLHDDITCDDLAGALEERFKEFEKNDLVTEGTAVIAHSTGAIVVRRWLLNRWVAGKPLPSHFISLAGANHGSSLAELGATQLAHVMRVLESGTSVGVEVLEDLDYGSEFLLKLNEEWLTAFNSSKPPRTYCFSLIGDNHSGIINQVFWQTHENGCDTTVRVSGGNLNYHFLSVDQTVENPVLVVDELTQPVPHLVLGGISHSGSDGILGGNAQAMAIVFPRVLEALGVVTRDDYVALESNWREITAQWNLHNVDQCNSTILFSLKHPGGRRVEDSLILIQDQTGEPENADALVRVGQSLESRQPICNNVTRSSISFYVNYQKFTDTYPHRVRIHINSGTDEITYPAADYVVSAGDKGGVRPNEFVYVKVTLKRQSGGTLVVVPFRPDLDIQKRWPPMPA